MTERRPNIVLITVDTLRRDHVSLYGYPRRTTPNIDEFFREGTTFERATSPAPCTNPAIKQVFSGLRNFDENRPPLAKILRGHGYATAAVVSQHHFRTGSGPRPEYSRGFDHFDIQSAAEQDHHHMSTRTASEVSERAIAWLAAGSRQQPFFLWLHYFDPHDPYEAPAPHRVFDTPDPNLGGDVRTYLAQRRKADESRLPTVSRQANSNENSRSIFSPEEEATLRSHYDAEILFVDTQVGRVLRQLEKEDLRRRTLVILTADHGERLGEEGRWGHCHTVHGSEINVPLMLSRRGPDGRAHVERAVSTLDIVPTVLSAAGVPFQASDFEGRQLLESSVDRFVYSAWTKERSVQDSHWKLTVPIAGGFPRLHDIRNDTAERRDLSAMAPDRVRRMSQALVEATPNDDEFRDRIAEALDELRAVGYLE